MARTFVQHAECPQCGSRDNLAIHDDGYAKCYGHGCGFYTYDYYGDGDEVSDSHHDRGRGVRASGGRADVDDSVPARRGARLIREWETGPLPKRGIDEETCALWKYGKAHFSGSPVQVANYFKDGRLIAQKVRWPNKDFRVLQEEKQQLPLYGQWLWRDAGKMLVITEGEIDALTVSQLQGNRWPVVSVPNGAQSASRSIKQNLEWVEKFDRVVFLFDMDEPGRQAARECALLLTPGKGHIGEMPLKDANEMLLAGRGKEVIDALWGAKVYRPDGIIAGDEVWEEITRPVEGACIPYPWDGLNTKLLGLRRGELVTVTAGSGIGKSAICRELAHHLLVGHEETVGYIALEESVKRTALGLMGINVSKPLHLDLRSFTELSDEEKQERRAAFDATCGSGRLYLYDHFGSLDVENLLARIRYLARGCDCRWVFLDHLSIVVSGLGDGDERRLIDNAMTKLRSLVEETGIGLVLVSHLKRPSGDKGHEDGAETHLSQLRGSAAIAQLSDAVIGIERDQQGDTPNRSNVRVLKNRFAGTTGIAMALDYEVDTGRLRVASPFDEEGGHDEDF